MSIRVGDKYIKSYWNTISVVTVKAIFQSLAVCDELCLQNGEVSEAGHPFESLAKFTPYTEEYYQEVLFCVEVVQKIDIDWSYAARLYKAGYRKVEGL